MYVCLYSLKPLFFGKNYAFKGSQRGTMKSVLNSNFVNFFLQAPLMCQHLPGPSNQLANISLNPHKPTEAHEKQPSVAYNILVP